MSPGLGRSISSIVVSNAYRCSLRPPKRGSPGVARIGSLRDSLTCLPTIASGMTISATQHSRSSPALMVMAASRAVVEPFTQVIEVEMSSSVRSAAPLKSVFALTNPLGSSCLRLSVVPLPPPPPLYPVPVCRESNKMLCGWQMRHP